MRRFILRRFLLLILVAFGCVSLTFSLLHLIPGDPAQAMAGEGAEAADIEHVRTLLGLDQPLWKQYLAYLGGVVRGDLGRSIRTGDAVSGMIVHAFSRTAVLAAASLVLATLIAIPAGSLGAIYKGKSIDTATTVFSLAGISIPNFWLGPMLIMIFSIRLGILPVSGTGGPAHLILPAVTLGTAYAALLARVTRAAVLDEIHAPYLTAVRARGVGPVSAFVRHTLRNALIPIVTVMALELGSLLTGSIVAEEVFSWPGLGRLVLSSIRSRDYPVVQGCVLFFSAIYVVVNFIADLLYASLDPRVRYGGGGTE
jgi:ABC-type dipeptide/oligopeptide/nickel transport system permease component